MPDFHTITTERLTLRRLEPKDLVRFAACRADPVLARYQGWSLLSIEEARSFIAEMQSAPAFATDTWLQIAIASRPGDELIGDIGLCLHAGGDAEIGFTLTQAVQGRGLATEALLALLPALFARPEVLRVVGITDERNVASIRVLERLGMTLAGRHEALFKGEACTELRYELERAR